MVADERYIPDVAYNSFAQQSKLTDDAYYPHSPDLAIEIMSPTDRERQILIKVGNYLAAGTTVWVVYPDEEAVYIYTPGEKVQILGKEDMLDGGDVIPGFTLELSKIFRD
jgi:Uma2 family endonuclease